MEDEKYCDCDPCVCGAEIKFRTQQVFYSLVREAEADAAQVERERIIGLLVEQLDRLVSDSFEWNGIAGDEYREFDPDRFKGRLLALIKGEQK